MARTILIKPIITEKAEMLTEDRNQYSFVVEKKANKVEIRKEVEKMYSVSVKAVNTLIMPAKQKNRSTRSGMLKGRKSAYKKAIVTLAEGNTIDHFGEM